MPTFFRRKQARGKTSEIPVAPRSKPSTKKVYDIEEDHYLLPSYTKSWESHDEVKTFGDYENMRSSQENDEESREHYSPPRTKQHKYQEQTPLVDDDDDDDEEDDRGSAVDFVRSFSTGEVWEDGTSPLDFVSAVATGQVVKDIFPSENIEYNTRAVNDDEERVPIEDDRDEEDQDPTSVSAFVNDVTSGKILEDGTSPLDFLKAVGSGAVLSDLGWASPNDQTEEDPDERTEVEDQTPLASSWFGKLEAFFLGDDDEAVATPQSVPQPEAEPVQETFPEEEEQPATRQAKQRSAVSNRRTPGRPRQKAVVRQVARSPTRRARGMSPQRKRIVREFSPDKRGGKFVDVKKSSSKKKGTRKSNTSNRSSPQRRRKPSTRASV